MRAKHSDVRVGIDLDNTLISYDRLFYELAVSREFIPADFSGTKREIRDHIRRLPDGEIEWQRLQAHAYGPAIAGATAAEGALAFIQTIRARGGHLSIVSHKSMFSNLGESGVNLRDASREWLRQSGIVGPQAVPEENVYFEDTRAEKIARIIALRCTHFIDDLEEVFDDPAFPSNVERLLLTGSAQPARGPYRTFASFSEIADVFDAG